MSPSVLDRDDCISTLLLSDTLSQSAFYGTNIFSVQNDVSNFSDINQNSSVLDCASVAIEQHYESLIDKRISYIRSLSTLSQNWVWGKSVIPNNTSIVFSVDFLSFIREFISTFSNCYPKIVMGPMPEGGVSIELHFTSENSIVINFTNSGDFEIETCEDGYFSEFECFDKDDFYYKFKELFVTISRCDINPKNSSLFSGKSTSVTYSRW